VGYIHLKNSNCIIQKSSFQYDYLALTIFFLKILYAMGPWTVIYFLCIVLFGRFYLINLVLAVVAASYENEVQNAKQVSM